MDRNENQNSFRNQMSSREALHEAEKLRRRSLVLTFAVIILSAALIACALLIILNRDKIFYGGGTAEVLSESGASDEIGEDGGSGQPDADNLASIIAESQIEEAAVTEEAESGKPASITVESRDEEPASPEEESPDEDAVVIPDEALSEETKENGDDSASSGADESISPVSGAESADISGASEAEGTGLSAHLEEETSSAGKNTLDEKIEYLMTGEDKYDLADYQYKFERFDKNGNSEILASGNADQENEADGFRRLIIADAAGKLLRKYKSEKYGDLKDSLGEYLGHGESGEGESAEDNLITLIGEYAVDAGAVPGDDDTDYHQTGLEYVSSCSKERAGASFMEDTVSRISPEWTAGFFEEIGKKDVLWDILKSDSAEAAEKDTLVSDLEKNGYQVSYYQETPEAGKTGDEKLAVRIYCKGADYIFVFFANGYYNPDLGTDLCNDVILPAITGGYASA